jgi:chromosome segregation ATPase
VHGFHLELAALQAQLSDKDALLQRALGDASQLDSERAAIAARAEDATQAALSLERQLREAQQSLQEAHKARAELAEKLAAVEARAEGLQGDQARWLRAEGVLRAQLEELQEQLDEVQQQRGQLQQQAKEAAQREADASRCACVSMWGCTFASPDCARRMQACMCDRDRAVVRR